MKTPSPIPQQPCPLWQLGKASVMCGMLGTSHKNSSSNLRHLSLGDPTVQGWLLRVHPQQGKKTPTNKKNKVRVFLPVSACTRGESPASARSPAVLARSLLEINSWRELSDDQGAALATQSCYWLWVTAGLKTFPLYFVQGNAHP